MISFRSRFACCMFKRINDVITDRKECFERSQRKHVCIYRMKRIEVVTIDNRRDISLDTENIRECRCIVLIF
jgi:hypothetical protein